MDDLYVYGSSFDDCLMNLENVLDRRVKVNLMLNWEKCHFMVNEVIVLRNLVFERGIEVDRANIEMIEKLNSPTPVRYVRSFLGQVSFYRQFIKDFSKISKPLIGLLLKDAEFKFNNDCLEAFQDFKNELISPPII